MSSSPPTPVDPPLPLEAIDAHARSLRPRDVETIRSQMHADACAKRQIEVRDQQLRSFVVKHSVIRIHCLVGLVCISIALALLQPGRAKLGGSVLGTIVIFLNVVILASSRTIARALRPVRDATERRSYAPREG